MNGISNHDHDGHHHDHEHGSSLTAEIMCHLPYAVFSVALCLSLLSFLWFLTMPDADTLGEVNAGLDILFHNFHFMHIVFAVVGSLVTYFRYARSIAGAFIAGVISPVFFCVFSDILIPYVGGMMLGVEMDLHICFVSELRNIVPFLLVGIVTGVVLSKNKAESQGVYSVFSHFIHILVSSLASMFYLVAHGFSDWHHDIGLLFLFLTIAVVIPCTLSDLVVPMMVAKARK